MAKTTKTAKTAKTMNAISALFERDVPEELRKAEAEAEVTEGIPEDIRKAEAEAEAYAEIAASRLAKAEERVDRFLANNIERFSADVVKFQSRLQDAINAGPNGDPAYAFKWGMDALIASAAVSAYNQLVALRPAYSVQELLDNARTMMMQGARHPESSTSPLSNLVSLYQTAAWAQFVEYASDQLKRTV